MVRRSLVFGFGLGLLLSLVSSGCGTPVPTEKSCDATNCQGCCSDTGDCLSGAALLACGAGGAACVACAANEVCEAGACGRFANGDYDASFPDSPDASIRYDAGTYKPPDAGTSVTDAGAMDAGPQNVSYSAQVQPIFDARCDSCHAWSYDTIVNQNGRIVPGNLNASSIYTRCQSGDMPRGSGPITATQLTLIRDWILNGAPRN